MTAPRRTACPRFDRVTRVQYAGYRDEAIDPVAMSHLPRRSADVAIEIPASFVTDEAHQKVCVENVTHTTDATSINTQYTHSMMHSALLAFAAVCCCRAQMTVEVTVETEDLPTFVDGKWLV